MNVRPLWLAGTAIALGVLWAPAGLATPANPIAAENSLPGTTTWQPTLPYHENITGYTSQVSVLPGGLVDLHVSTQPVSRYRVEVYRLGWYGGAGARLMLCLPACDSDEPGHDYPIPPPDPSTGRVVADWPITDEIQISDDWPSGYYVARLVRTQDPRSGWANDVPFIVRSPPQDLAPILVVASPSTWEAYNTWGGKSLYWAKDGLPAVEVSFDRPYLSPESWLPLRYELPLVRFLERESYDVSYTTDVDLDVDPGELLRHRLVIFVGHSEYWSANLRSGLQAALDAGTNLAFLGGNIGYWQIRYTDDHRTIIEYRSAALDPDPHPLEKTVRFRDLQPPEPECELLGVESNDSWVNPSDPPFAVEVPAAAASDPWFAGTGLVAGSVIPGIGGYEWDAVTPQCGPHDEVVLLHGELNGEPLDAVRYVAPSGARVFSAGSIDFSWGLDGFASGQSPSRGLQLFMENALSDLTRPAAPQAAQVSLRSGHVVITVPLSIDPRISGMRAVRVGLNGPLHSPGGCSSSEDSCVDRRSAPGQRYRYAVQYGDRWGWSAARVTPSILDERPRAVGHGRGRRRPSRRH